MEIRSEFIGKPSGPTMFQWPGRHNLAVGVAKATESVSSVADSHNNICGLHPVRLQWMSSISLVILSKLGTGVCEMTHYA